MVKDYYNISIPLEVGDIIQPKGFINEYLIDDIIVYHSAKTKKTDVILKLIDKSFDNKYNIVSSFNYTDHEWVILKTNKEVCKQNEQE